MLSNFKIVRQRVNICCPRLQCSFYPPCRSSNEENDESVEEFRRRLGNPGTTFACWFNPLSRPDFLIWGPPLTQNISSSGIPTLPYRYLGSIGKDSSVVHHRKFHLGHVLNGVTWSLAVLVVSVALLLLMIRRGRCFH